MALLEARQISKRFGGLSALNGLDFSLEEGMIAGLIGPNGAGKTTFFNMITGLYRPTSGQLVFAGRDITGRRPNRIASLGISRTFQTIRLFGNMTALDNVLVGMNCRLRASWLGAIVRPPWVVREEQQARQKRTSYSTTSVSPTGPGIWPEICHMVTSACWKLPAPWLLRQSCCCWMSPRRA